MDKHYNKDIAKATLEQSACENKETNNRRLSNVANNPRWFDDIKIVQTGNPLTWRLMNREDGQLDEEVVLCVQGILSAKELPPLWEKPTAKPNRFKYLKQGVTITGLGTPTFESAVAAAVNIYGHIDRTFTDAQLQSWQAPIHSDGKTHYLELSNRYFTPSRDVPDVASIPFDPSVDPKGILTAMANSTDKVKHIEENKVNYYSVSIDKEGGKGYTIGEPQMFCVGDIVEAQISICAIPIGKNSFKLIFVLRSLALIDSTFSREAFRKRTHANQQPTTVARLLASSSVKRRVGYGHTNNEEISRERSKHLMDVDTN